MPATSSRVLLALALALTGSAVAATSAGAASASAQASARSSVQQADTRPESFKPRTIHAYRGTDQITVTWPRRKFAKDYVVTWSPLTSAVPVSRPAQCRLPVCKKRRTTGTKVVLSAADLSTPNRTVSSASGNTVRFKVFARNGTALNWSGVRPPHADWVAPSPSATVNWLPSIASQLPKPLPPVAGTDVAVTSFNVLSSTANPENPWKERRTKVAEQIDTAQSGGMRSSIVLTQENTNAHQNVPGNISQFDDLAKLLRPKGWALSDGRSWDKELCLAEHRPRCNYASTSAQATRIYYRTANWRQMDNGALLTNAPLSIPGYTTKPVDTHRWVAWTKLEAVNDPSTEVCVISAHLLTNRGKPDYNRESALHRRAEMQQILSELNNPNSDVKRIGTRVGQACDGIPTIFGGDLNSAEEHPPFGNQPQSMMVADGFVDTKNAGQRINTKYTGTGPLDAWHTTWGTEIDYLLTEGMGGAKTFTVNAVGPDKVGSDHYPITALISIPKTPAP